MLVNIEHIFQSQNHLHLRWHSGLSQRYALSTAPREHAQDLRPRTRTTTKSRGCWHQDNAPRETADQEDPGQSIACWLSAVNE